MDLSEPFPFTSLADRHLVIFVFPFPLFFLFMNLVVVVCVHIFFCCPCTVESIKVYMVTWACTYVFLDKWMVLFGHMVLHLLVLVTRNYSPAGSFAR